MTTLWILLFATTLLAALAYFAQVYPHRPLVLVALVPGLLSVGLVASGELFWWLVGLDSVALGLVVIDLAALPWKETLTAERQVGLIASLGGVHPVTLTISNLRQRDLTVWIRDGVPEALEADPEEFTVVLRGLSRSTVHYQMRASRRGAFTLSAVYLRVRSRWGMWQRLIACQEESRVNVYPDMKQLGEYAILARTNRLSLLGVRRTRKIGRDNEFERLRDYTLDDSYKHIDWRATARRHKLTVKDFQANQSQRIIFLIDCGRMMTGQSEGLSLLDHALNAMLMLSYVALRQGDQVGLLPFSDEIHRFVPPRGGMSQMNHLLHASFDQFPRMVESRYDDAFLYLAAHCRKRALVILVTNVIDEVNASQIERYLSTLSGRHLPLGVLLRDHRLFDAVDVPAVDDETLYRAGAAAEILTWRHQVLTDLESHGVLSLDVFPEHMTAPLVNRYLDIKARHLL